MADVSHELGSLRFVVESPLSSKVAMFNNQAQQHKQSQLLNPFSNSDGRASPKPTFSKDEYGKPLAGSLTEQRGQKANIHVMKEMLELCQIINTEGYNVKDEPTMRVIPFGELFNIYNYISDKVVGILLRARKYKLVEFEGEMLFQRRDDDVPIFLLKPIKEIREELDFKIDDIKRASSPAPQATTLIMDKAAHQQKLQEAGLAVPNRRSKSRSQSPAVGNQSKAASPAPGNKSKAASPAPATTPLATQTASPIVATETAAAATVTVTPTAVAAISASAEQSERTEEDVLKPEATTISADQNPAENVCSEAKTEHNTAAAVADTETATPTPQEVLPTVEDTPATHSEEQVQMPQAPAASSSTEQDSNKTDLNNNITDTLPTIIIDSSEQYSMSTENETPNEAVEPAAAPVATSN